MKKKIFLAINLPENIKDKLILYAKSDDFALLPVRWLDKESLQLMVEFLGYADDDQIYEITQRLHELKEELSLFSLNFNKINAGPIPKKPKIIWVRGEGNEILKELNRNVKDMVSDINLVKKGKRHNFIPHITLGIIEKSQINDFKMEEKELKMSFSVESIDLMESYKEKNKVKYSVLERISF